MKKLQQKLHDVQEAFKNKSMSVNKYSLMYHLTFQSIKK